MSWVLIWPEIARVAQLHALEAQTPRMQYREVSVEVLPAAEQPSSFDTVTCMECWSTYPTRRPWYMRAQLVKPGDGFSSLQLIATPRHSCWPLSVLNMS